MRPLRLELEGFTAFRDPVVVDFEGADLFAVTGPTGSGKSSLIDAIGFALYGSVPRYLNPKIVAPVIAAGRLEARVRFDFLVGDDAYTAVRVVRRTKGGATTKEARLEGPGGEVLAGNERELSTEVERLLGLGFDHFTTCVVVPQGEFARFLHHRAGQRQDVLVRLLDLGLYERMAKLARGREQAAASAAALAEARLADLAFATPEAHRQATARLAALEELKAAVDAELPRLAALDARVAEAEAMAAEASGRVALLVDVAVPAEAVELGAVVAAASAEAAAAREAEATAEKLALAAEEALRMRPSSERLAALLTAHADADAAREEVARAEPAVAQRRRAEHAASEELTAAEAAHRQAADERDAAQWRHRAHDLRTTLRPGEACPVCEQVVAAVPGSGAEAEVTDLESGAGEVERARAALELAASRLDSARRSQRDAAHERVRREEKLMAARARLDQVAQQLAIAPEASDLGELRRAHQEVERDEADYRQRMADERQARASRSRAEERLAGLVGREAEARWGFEDQRDRVTALGPPVPERRDLVADWEELARWAADQAVVAEKAAVGARAHLAELADERNQSRAALRARCEEQGVEVGGGAPRDAVVEARARTAGTAERIEQALAEADQRRAELAQHREQGQVAGALARHLGATGFERWVLDEALELLVAGATEVLFELSAGAYSLTLDQRSSSFSVVDHRNADELRSARTLSGGETFLASLALALALSDQLAALAARHTARLESIFLDEGFGSLDPDTLDTVATAIEELGARGRVVGVVTHVAELAERVPVRFQVTKGPATSTVERVTA